MDEQPTLPAEIRASLPPVAQAYVAFLEGQIAVLREQVSTLQMVVSKLQGQLADAHERKSPHSGNYSRSPSTDPPDAPPRPKRPPSGRKRGGQPGHPGHARVWLKSEDLTRVVVHRPTQCPSCTLPLTPALPCEGEPQRLQVWEIPPIHPEVTEHRGYAVRCPHCQALAPAPDLPTSAFGPRLTALGSFLHGRYRLSVRETAGVIEDIIGVPIGVGTIPTLCQETSTALEDTFQAVAAQVTVAKHANVDETGWKQAGARRWLWTAVTETCTLFRIAPRRNAAVLPTLLGDNFAGIVSSDRFGVYRSFPVERRQVRLAHLKRNLTAFAERGGRSR